MAKQDRAIRTRQTILRAAAKIFEEYGYEATTISEILAEAGVTKGALYFHFQSKEQLAQGVLNEQDSGFIIPARACKVQEIVDASMLHAYRLQTDPMVRASVRLSMDQRATSLDRAGPFRRWSELAQDLLDQAQAQGELLPHITTKETANVIVGAFGGVQSMSQALSDYSDLLDRVSDLMRLLLPSVAQPSVIASLHMSASRGAEVYEEAVRLTKEHEAALLSKGMVQLDHLAPKTA
ncbi:ScbR family autoregulator-binding transcription factor [Streptomyces sp. NPDC004542]|uniref:ScbR family autoregulator-binding transcription factor n=1 Tax=Streptomyces sp. NPDC004542 TaxID=3154281 RepID=UPI0033AA35E7